MDLKSQFDQQGFLSPLDALSPDEVARHRGAYDAIEAELGPERCKIGLVHEHRNHQFIWDLATHVKVLDALEAVIGPNIVLLGTHVFCKYPTPTTESQFVAWHQDATYWGLDPMETTTAWLAIDDADVENGCMQLAAGSHKLGLLDHGKSDKPGNLLSVNQAIDERLFDPASAVNLEMAAGQFSLHDGLAVHSSNPNHSTRRRCGLTLRYITPAVRILGHTNKAHTWQPVLVRGEDRFGYNTYANSPFPGADVGDR